MRGILPLQPHGLRGLVVMLSHYTNDVLSACIGGLQSPRGRQAESGEAGFVGVIGGWMDILNRIRAEELSPPTGVGVDGIICLEFAGKRAFELHFSRQPES